MISRQVRLKDSYLESRWSNFDKWHFWLNTMIWSNSCVLVVSTCRRGNTFLKLPSFEIYDSFNFAKLDYFEVNNDIVHYKYGSSKTIN